LAAVALGMVVLSVVLAMTAPLLPLPEPNATDLGARLLPPLSSGHWLGTDQLGRDIGARLIFGLRLSLLVAFVGVAVAGMLGSLLGVVAAYFGRATETVVMRSIDVLMAFPYLLLALAIVAALGPGLVNATLAIAVVNVPFFARTARGAALGVMAEDFVMAARAVGASNARVLFAHVAPAVASPLAVAASASLGWMLLETAGLSFLGLGAQPPTADLGGMLGQARHLAATAPHVMLAPGLTIFALAMAVNVLGDVVRDLSEVRRVAVTKPEASPVAESSDGGAEPADRRGGGDAEAEPLLQVESLRVRFSTSDGVVDAVSGVSFEIHAGERVALVGESGSGKSATALAVLDLLPPAATATASSLRHRGQSLGELSPAQRRGLLGAALALVPQDPQTSLHPLYSVGEQMVEAILRHQPVSRAAAWELARRLLDELKVADASARLHAHPHELSGGMRQRVAIAMALANAPGLVVADEPTTALDPTTQAAVLEAFSELTERRGTAILYITHDLGVVAEICTRVMVMHEGRIVESAPTEELFRAPRHAYTKKLLAAAQRADMKRRSAAVVSAPS